MPDLSNSERAILEAHGGHAGTYVQARLVRLLRGNGNAALFLAHLLWWAMNKADDGGWFFRTQEAVAEYTGLGKRAQRSARKLLGDLGFLEEDRKGLPAKLHFRVDLQALAKALLEQPNQESPHGGEQGLRKGEKRPTDDSRQEAAHGANQEAAHEARKDEAHEARKDEAHGATLSISKKEKEKEEGREGAPARAAAGQSERDLSFLTPQDRDRHADAIHHNLRQLEGEPESNTGTMLQRLKRQTFGGGTRMNGEWRRALLRFHEKHGWAKTVAACTIAARQDLSLPTITSVAEQWLKHAEDPNPRSGMPDLTARARERAKKRERIQRFLAQQKSSQHHRATA